MKVLLVNGSPHAEGSTFTALSETEKALHAAGVDTEWYQLGTQPVRGCVACRKCAELGRCAFDDDGANRLAEAIKGADGVVVGSPVYYAGPNAALCALLERAFYSAARNNFAGKVAAAVVCCRRGGATAALDRLNKFFTISRMPVASSQYWNMAHGNSGAEVQQDAEGMQTMRTLGAQVAWMLQGLAGKAQPAQEEPARTNFIR